MRQLLPFQYVETIARHGSIRKAAEVLAITPSALNRRLQSLEKELGVAVFERLPTGVRLSTAGEILLEHIRNQISDMERVKSRIADLAGMRRGNVTVATGAEFSGDFLPRQINSYRQEFPGVTFQIRQVARSAAGAALIDHSADIALIFEPITLAEFQIVFSSRQPVMCVMASDHELAGNEIVRLYECCQFPMLLPDAASGLRQMLDASAVRLGLELGAAVESNSLALLRQCTQGTGHISFDIPINIPQDLASHNLAARPLDTRDAADGFLFAGHLKGRALPVAAARFLEQIVASLAGRFG